MHINTPSQARDAEGTRPNAVLVLVCAAAFMVVLDTTTVVTALPSITRDLGLDVAGAQWVVVGYTVCYGSLMLVGGRLADLYGRRRIFVGSVAAFVAASAACGFASTAGWLIGARVAQGISAAVVVPASLSLVVATFAEGSRRNRAMGIWNAIAGAGGTLGLLVGGPLTDGPGWRWIFFLNVPLGAAALVLSPVVLPPTTRAQGVRMDLPGGASATGALLALVYGLSRLPDTGWSDALTIGALLSATALAALFVRTERRAIQPLVPFRLLRNRAVVGGNLVLVVTGAAAGFFFTFTLFAQQVLGYSASQFGLATVATGATSVIVGLVAHSLVTRWGSRMVVCNGLLALAAAMALLARTPARAGYAQHLLVPLLLAGIGIGVCGVAASIAALAGVSEHDAGVASGIEESTWAVGEPLGVVAMATVAAVVTSARLDDGAAEIAARASGYRASFVVAAALCVAGVAVASALLPGPVGSSNLGEP